MLQQPTVPDDYVIATGETHSVREFADRAFRRVGIDLEWEGRGRRGDRASTAGRATVLVSVDPRYFRPTEVELLLGDASRARPGWAGARAWTSRQLVRMMVDAEVAARCGVCRR